MIIVGAGLAGLLAGAMLRGENLGIVEASDDLPSNHSAVLRFRSKEVSHATGIPFRQVKVVKSFDPWRNPVADAMAYSRKTNGGYFLRSILTSSAEPQERFIAPPDLVSRMAKKAGAIRFGRDGLAMIGGSPVISTVPMPVLMAKVGWEAPEFKSRSGFNINAKVLNADAYWSVYFPSPSILPYRVSLTGDNLCIEMAVDMSETNHNVMTVIDQVAHLCGINFDEIVDARLSEQRYAKITPICEVTRRRFIMHMTERYNVYSLGRFATWRPGLLLDDVVNDVRVIQRLISSQHGESYSHKLKES